MNLIVVPDVRIDRLDVAAGRVAPKTIERGIVVPPGLQVNTETLDAHQRRMRREGRRPLDREEAIRIFDAGQAEAWFGPADQQKEPRT